VIEVIANNEHKVSCKSLGVKGVFKSEVPKETNSYLPQIKCESKSCTPCTV
jgi:hypothetical protein